MRLRRREDRPVAPPPDRFRRLRAKLDLREPPVAGSLLDLLHRGVRIVLRHQDRGAQPRLHIGEFISLPVVHRGTQHRRLVEVARRVAAEQRLQHAVGDVVLVEQLLADERDIGPWRSAVGRKRITPRQERLEPRVGAALRIRAGVELAILGKMLAPALRHVLFQRARLGKRMDIAIDNPQHLAGLLVLLQDADGRVHCTVSFRRG